MNFEIYEEAFMQELYFRVQQELLRRFFSLQNVFLFMYILMSTGTQQGISRGIPPKFFGLASGVSLESSQNIHLRQ